MLTIDEHILHLMQTASQEIDRKYRIGQKEHGGHLWEKFSHRDYLILLRDEIIDAFVYVQCALDQLEQQQEKACTAGQS